MNVRYIENHKATSSLRPLIIDKSNFQKDFFKLKLGTKINQEIIFQKIEDKNNNIMYLVAVDILMYKESEGIENNFNPSNKNLYELRKENQERGWS